MMMLNPINTARSLVHQVQEWKDSPQELVIARKYNGRILDLIHQLRPVYAGRELIRVGPAGDGGYLLPDDLSGIQACFSPGVHTQIAFDRDIANRGIRVHLADASVSEPPGMPENMTFIPKFVGGVTNEQTVTMQDWLRQVQEEGEHDLMLQMDIEGSEYEVLASMPLEILRRFRILAIEFHMLDQLWNPGFLYLVKPLFQRLLLSHVCVHLHPNNWCGVFNRAGVTVPRVMEFSFLRRDRIRGDLKPIEFFPHPLDMDNKDKPSIVLPEYWWK
jgi:hypothetical protein